ncbi:MAG: thioredoxin-dependent thiol peroxidase [Candidatus Gastranaerophilales bacterium]|nr:thioredoxin-dependent thiol peroxidase [Candidatus Gastranaerophilales bacterium]
MSIENLKLQGIDKDGNEKEYSLADFKGKKLVLYFYPKDNTPGCTQEACDFRDNFNRLTSLAQVVGVSPDSIKSHKGFQDKHELNFTLLSDPEHKLAEAFEAWSEKSMYGKKYMGIVRSTFLLDENNNVIKSWKDVKVQGHVDEVIDELQQSV